MSFRRPMSGRQLFSQWIDLWSRFSKSLRSLGDHGKSRMGLERRISVLQEGPLARISNHSRADFNRAPLSRLHLEQTKATGPTTLPPTQATAQSKSGTQNTRRLLHSHSSKQLKGSDLLPLSTISILEITLESNKNH